MQNNAMIRLTRSRNLQAMQTLVITIGGASGYREWLAAMPEDVKLAPSGGVEQSFLMAVADNNEAYDKLFHTFKNIMIPILAEV